MGRQRGGSGGQRGSSSDPMLWSNAFIAYPDLTHSLTPSHQVWGAGSAACRLRLARDAAHCSPARGRLPQHVACRMRLRPGERAAGSAGHAAADQLRCLCPCGHGPHARLCLQVSEPGRSSLFNCRLNVRRMPGHAGGASCHCPCTSSTKLLPTTTSLCLRPTGQLRIAAARARRGLTEAQGWMRLAGRSAHRPPPAAQLRRMAVCHLLCTILSAVTLSC